MRVRRPARPRGSVPALSDTGQPPVNASPWLLLAIVVVPVALALLIAAWPRWRLRQLTSQPFPPAWAALLSQRLWLYDRLSGDERARLHALIRQFLFEKRFFGCGGLDVTEPMRVLIAAQACLLMLHRRGDLYPRLRFILVYPDAFVAPKVEYLPGGVEVSGEQDLEGESWSDGKLILSWDDIERDLDAGSDGFNVTLHEFAHQLDDEWGASDGAPLLPDAAAGQRWAAVMTAAYERLLAAVEAPATTSERAWPGRCGSRRAFAIDPYGATSPAEFFAVVTEQFFEQPATLAAAEPELFAELMRFYCLDPRLWHERPGGGAAVD